VTQSTRERSNAFDNDPSISLRRRGRRNTWIRRFGGSSPKVQVQRRDPERDGEQRQNRQEGNPCRREIGSLSRLADGILEISQNDHSLLLWVLMFF